MAIIELKFEDLIPSVFAGARAAGKRKQVSAQSNPARGAALNSARADFIHAHDGENRPECLDLFLINIAVRLDRDIAPGKPCAAR
jgi:hypothetical protein